MKRMKWSLFLLFAIIGTLVLLELFVWSGQRLQGYQTEDVLRVSTAFLTGLPTFLALTAAVATIYGFHKLGLAPPQIAIGSFQHTLPVESNDMPRDPAITML